jgi:hypothetical protein
MPRIQYVWNNRRKGDTGVANDDDNSSMRVRAANVRQIGFLSLCSQLTHPREIGSNDGRKTIHAAAGL